MRIFDARKQPPEDVTFGFDQSNVAVRSALSRGAAVREDTVSLSACVFYILFSRDVVGSSQGIFVCLFVCLLW